MTILTAHSGADGFPDNSLVFVRHALASGADALEIDGHIFDGNICLAEV